LLYKRGLKRGKGIEKIDEFTADRLFQMQIFLCHMGSYSSKRMQGFPIQDEPDALHGSFSGIWSSLFAFRKEKLINFILAPGFRRKANKAIMAIGKADLPLFTERGEVFEHLCSKTFG
jgi:hypothetical protein